MPSYPLDPLAERTCFSQVVLWLKLAINLLHAVGKSSQLLWGIWVTLSLGVTVCILVLVRPYISTVDERVETDGGSAQHSHLGAVNRHP